MTGSAASVVPAAAGSSASGKPETITGLALPFSEATTIGGAFQELFLPGAFRAQANDWRASGVQLRFQHVNEFLLGNTLSGTLVLRSNRDGLYFSASLPASMAYPAELIRRGDIAQVSPGFRTIRDEWQIVGGVPRRTVIEARLAEISICAAGSAAYPSTWVAGRTAVVKRIRELERQLEPRVGKKLSKTSVAAIQAAIGHLHDLLATNTGEDADEEVWPEIPDTDETAANDNAAITAKKYPNTNVEAQGAIPGARMTNAEARARLAKLDRDEIHRRLVDLKLYRRHPGGSRP